MGVSSSCPLWTYYLPSFLPIARASPIGPQERHVRGKCLTASMLSLRTDDSASSSLPAERPSEHTPSAAPPDTSSTTARHTQSPSVLVPRRTHLPSVGTQTTLALVLRSLSHHNLRSSHLTESTALFLSCRSSEDHVERAKGKEGESGKDVEEGKSLEFNASSHPRRTEDTDPVTIESSALPAPRASNRHRRDYRGDFGGPESSGNARRAQRRESLSSRGHDSVPVGIRQLDETHLDRRTGSPRGCAEVVYACEASTPLIFRCCRKEY